MADEPKLTEEEVAELTAYDKLGELSQAEVDGYRKRCPNLGSSLKLHSAWSEQRKAIEAATAAAAAAAPEPSAPAAAGGCAAATGTLRVQDVKGDDTAAKLTRFFIHHGVPEKIQNVDAIIDSYRGIEGELWMTLTDKYGPGPDASYPTLEDDDAARAAAAVTVMTSPHVAGVPKAAGGDPSRRTGMRGTLRKQALGRRLFGMFNWKERYFLLDEHSPGQLYYFATEDDADDKAKAKGSIPLDRRAALLVPNPTKEHHPEANPNLQQFMIVFDEDKHERKLLLCAEDDRSKKEQWVACLRQYIKVYNEAADA